MQNTQQDHSFILQTQPSFVFEPAQIDFLEPELQKLILQNKNQSQQPPPRVCKFHLKKIKALQQKVKSLERQVRKLRKLKSSPINNQQITQTPEGVITIQQTSSPLHIDPNTDCLADIQQQQQVITNILNNAQTGTTPGGSLQFQQFEITPNSPREQQMEINGQTWIVMGMLMMVMGININGYDGSIDAYKITRETVDSIRKQVQKSAQEVVFPVFYSKLFSIEGSAGMESSPMDGCFQLQGLRLESINQQDLMFQEHLNFRLKYQALLVIMQYMKQYASLG